MFATRMKQKKVSTSGAQVLTYFAPTFGSTIRVADELDDELQRVHEAGRQQPVLSQIAPDGQRDQQEDGRGDEQQHEDMLRDREVDTENRG